MAPPKRGFVVRGVAGGAEIVVELVRDEWGTRVWGAAGGQRRSRPKTKENRVPKKTQGGLSGGLGVSGSEKTEIKKRKSVWSRWGSG